MEPRFGADFSGVRVHTGSTAVRMNQDVNAQAFAHGQDVYFGAGKAPGKDALMAHELTHIVQQNPAQKNATVQAKKRAISEAASPVSLTDTHVIQRFEASEHRSLGDLNASTTPIDFPEGTLFSGSPALSYGEIIALSGDFYGSFDHLASPYYINAEGGEVTTDPDQSKQRKISEIKKLTHLFQVEAEIRATGREPEGLDLGYVEHNGETLEGFEKVTGGRYLALAEQNFPHFTVAERGNISTWMEGHEKALVEAYEAGVLGDTRKKLLALARNAASNHFLTDAFSTGHMRVPRSDIDQYYRNMLANVAPALVNPLLEKLPEEIVIPIDLRKFVPDAAAPILDRIPGVSSYLQHRISIEIRSKVASAIAPCVQSFTQTMRDTVGPKLGGLVSKWLHDTDNKNGLLVTNEAGGRWMAYGDGQLDNTPPPGVSVNTTNRDQAQKAVLADRTEVEKMYNQGEARSKPTPTNQHGTTGLIPKNVYFDFDRPKTENDPSSLSSSGRADLDSLAQYLNSIEGVTVILEGWADSRGSNAYNIGLASRRISAIRTYLTAAGVASAKIGDPSAHGEPLAATTASDHHLFRRVDINLERTPCPIQEPASNQGNDPTNVPISNPFAANKFLPRVEEGNTPMQPYQWCSLNAAQKTSLRNGVEPIVKNGLVSIMEAAVHNSLPHDYKIDVTIPVPVMDDIHIQEKISIQDLAINVAKPIIKLAINDVMTDMVFGTLMDGACLLNSPASK